MVGQMHIVAPMNSLLALEIYRHLGCWCFTDHDRGLRHEPFVLGMTEIIDYVINEYKLGDLIGPYRIIFSANKFPKHQGHLFYQYAEDNGTWYALSTPAKHIIDEDSPRGWLCPATLEFFDYFPKFIYFKIEPVNK